MENSKFTKIERSVLYSILRFTHLHKPFVFLAGGDVAIKKNKLLIYDPSIN